MYVVELPERKNLARPHKSVTTNQAVAVRSGLTNPPLRLYSGIKRASGLACRVTLYDSVADAVYQHFNVSGACPFRDYLAAGVVRHSMLRPNPETRY